MAPTSSSTLTCSLCGHSHRPVTLRHGETARCVRCDRVLALAPGRFGAHATTTFALAGLAFAAPAGLLPFITVEKLGNARSGDFLASVSALANHGMPVLALWVLVCAGIAPVLLLAFLVAGRPRFSRSTALAGRILGPWAMPEVLMLAVLVALTRLGSVVDVELETGFWCYAAFSLFFFLAGRAHRLGHPA